MTDNVANAPADVPENDTVDGATFEAEVVEGELLPDDGSHLEAEPIRAHDLGLELPADPAQAQQMLLDEIATARADANEYLETVQRLAADFENFRKRAQRDQRDVVEHAALRIVEAMLPTLDSFDAALSFDAQTPTEEKLLDGMRGTYQQLMDTLEREGLGIIPAEGTPFDPAVHEAVAAPAELGDADLVVVQELRRGYRIRERVVRPSLVRVDHA